MGTGWVPAASPRPTSLRDDLDRRTVRGDPAMDFTGVTGARELAYFPGGKA
ncbi:MAG: hypothetical protein ACYCV7_12795 [Acidimicrobiales bacterium]